MALLNVWTNLGGIVCLYVSIWSGHLYNLDFFKRWGLGYGAKTANAVDICQWSTSPKVGHPVTPSILNLKICGSWKVLVYLVTSVLSVMLWIYGLSA